MPDKEANIFETDCTLDSTSLFINEAKLWLDTGSMFGVDGEDFERINVACPRKTLEEGLEAWRRAYEARGF